jgi:hypothetical protein
VSIVPLESPASARKALFEQLRHESTWRLLAATKSPAVLAIVQTVFPPKEHRLPRSELLARLAVHLDLLVDEGRETQMSAADYADAWVREGWLVRRDDPDRVETTYEPSPAAIDALSFTDGLQDRLPTTTESRLELVVQSFERLAEDTEASRDRRLADLQSRRERIEAEIRALSDSADVALPAPEASTDRLRDVLKIADGLSSDFLQYREDLRAVDADLREQILAPEGSRGDVLERLLAGDDLLGQSAVGRTFTAFFAMLNDPLQNQRAQDVVDRLLERDFARRLPHAERERLANVFSDLYEPAQEVLDVKSELYRSLARFVRSQDFRHHRALLDALQEAQGLALAQKDTVASRSRFPLELDLSRVLLSSVTQLHLKDPTDPGAPQMAEEAVVSTLSVEVLADLVRTQDIDMVALTGHVNDVVERTGQASLADVLEAHPAEQGLASVIGLMFLATQNADPQGGGSERVRWTETDGRDYVARVPRFWFLEPVSA